MTGTVDFTRVRPETLDMLRQRADAEGVSVDGLLELAIVAYDRASRRKSVTSPPAARVPAPSRRPDAAKPSVPPVMKPTYGVPGFSPAARQSAPEFIDFASEQGNAVILNGRPAEFFLHAGVIAVFVNGVRSTADSWGTAIQVMCDEIARTHHLRGDDLARFLKENVPGFRVSPGRLTQNGYKYNPNQNISVQVMSTAKNADSAIKMAGLAKVRLSIFVRWRETAGSSLRGRLGLVGEKLETAS